MTNEAVRLVLNYNWPGNVRQLDSVIEKAVLLAQGDFIFPAEIDIPVAQTAQEENIFNGDFPIKGISLEEIERQVILKAMEKSDGCMSKAAGLLNTTYRTIEYRVKKYNIHRPNQRKGEDVQPKR